MIYLRIPLLLAAYLMVGTSSPLLAQEPSATEPLHSHDGQHVHVTDTTARRTAHPYVHNHAMPHDHNHHGEHVHTHDHGHSHSHNEWSIGALGSFATHDASFNSLPPVENCCTGFDAKDGLGFGFQVGYTMPLSDDGWLITPRLGYTSLPVEFESYSTEKAFTGDVKLGTALFRHTLDVNWTTLNAGLTAEYGLGKIVWLGIGMEGLFLASASYRQTETLEQPTNLVFETGTRVRLDRNGYLRDFATMVFNATGSLRVRLIPKRTSAGLDVFVRYSYPLSPVFAPQTWDGIGGNPARAFYIDRYQLSMLTAGLAIVL